jgi:hypothetical protein
MLKTTTEKIIALVGIFFALCLVAGFIIAVVGTTHDNQKAIDGGLVIMGTTIGVGTFILLMYMVGKTMP